ncbi:HEAT repeat domain-containing protein [uncultured Paludibaculum sp.]|uniref:HEAT repeat domain-containing protein n=1 Tax=uncultured Paludibaculum sp. TaxID=1765020 RepID=UPI002AAB3FD6|nr:HEAT repeat domain-containing protein [uncultured Paludibaculum sp.]
MTCETARQQMVLFVYGELSFDEEEMVEQHLETCGECRAERVRLESMNALLEPGEADVPAGLLARCRRDLVVKVQEERAIPRRRIAFASLWRNWVVAPPMWLRPIGAVAMLAIGFFAARLVPSDSPSVTHMGLSNDTAPMVSRVRYVDPDDSGRVRVMFDETHQREVSGEVTDANIRRLLLAAAVDPGDPGLRVESIDILKRQCSDDEVRRALLNALKGDPNAGVRLKALEGLKTYAQDPETRKVLAQVLLSDDNPGVRTQAIDLLVQNKEPEVAGVLQELLRREDNSYVRSRSQKALTEMRASVGTF